MSRIPRKNISMPFLYIMIQGNNKNFIFEDNKDKEKYKISYRISSHILDIGREKLRVLIKWK